MFPNTAARSSGLDISLLGTIMVGVGVYVPRLESSAGTMPHLLRFFDKPPGTTYPAVTPQDKALLLLTDPETSSSTATLSEPAFSLDPLWTVLAYLGAALILIGPLWAWANRR